MAGLMTGDIKEGIRELAQPATEKLVEETTLKVRKARERKINKQIVPMCRRVKAYRKSKVRFLFPLSHFSHPLEMTANLITGDLEYMAQRPP